MTGGGLKENGESPSAGDEPTPSHTTVKAPRTPDVAQIGRYRLCFELASGGMATVYLARVKGPGGFDKLVALKCIHPHLAHEEEFVAMFLDEARIAARISHPNVCSVFEFGEQDGRYFLAMEYLLGETLGRVMKTISQSPDHVGDRRLPAVAAKIIADACEGLHSAHDLRDDRGELLNVVHRDISPANLFVTYDGGVKVVDFGIARAQDRIHDTRSGQVKGKFAYMSPEQLQGLEIDRRADVFSLAVVLWEMVTCRRLFRREREPDTIRAVMEQPIEAPSKYRQTVSSDLDAIILRALSRDPDKRYATARDFGRALSRYLGRHPDHIATADVADWMGELFREEAARRRELTEMARQMGNSGIPRISGDLVAKSDETLEMPLSEVLQGRKLPPTTPVPEIEIGLAGPPSRGSRGPWIATGVLAGVVVIGGIAVAVAWPSAAEPGESRNDAVAMPAEAAPAPGGEPVAVTQAGGEAASDEGSSATEAEAAAATMDPAGPQAGEDSPAVEVAGAAEAQGEAEAAQEAGEEAPAEEAPAEEAPAEAASPQEREARPGFVSVVTPGGWADLLVDGRRAGRSPDTLRLSPGRHVVTLRPFGEGPTQRRVIEVRAGRTARLSVPVTP